MHNSWKFLATLCGEAKVKIKIGEAEKEVPPLLLVEVNSRSTEDDLVRVLCAQIKALVYDKKAARAVIVLSDALAAQNLTPGRFLWSSFYHSLMLLSLRPRSQEGAVAWGLI